MNPSDDETSRRAKAEDIQHDHPRWLVVYGVYTHQYVAFPRFDAPTGTILSAAKPGELVRQLQRTEARFTPAE